MLAAVALNPAIDCTIRLGELRKGQVNRVREVRRYAGGKGINVAKVLRQTGEEVKVLGFSGGYTGKFIENYLTEIGAEIGFTRVSGETRTNMNVVSDSGEVTEILEPGLPVSDLEISLFLQSCDAALTAAEAIIFSGSLPQGMPSDIYARLIAKAKSAGVKTFLDTSGDALSEGIREAPYLVKPNEKEMETLCGKRAEDERELAHLILELMEEGTKHVVVSRGSRGLFSVMRSGEKTEAISVSVPGIKVCNTVGSGDVCTAVFAHGLGHGESEDARQYEETLKWAAACSAANCMTMENGSFSEETAKELLNEVRVRRFLL